MTQASIRDGFASLREDRDLLPLADAAKCRSEADWLVGINGTRAMTAFNSKEGGFYLTTVGRVQTPTLAILVEREEKIRAFQPRDYWEVHARFGAKAGRVRRAAGSIRSSGRTTTPSARPSASGRPRGPRRSPPPAAASRAWPPRRPSPRRRLSPLLYDLTSLQREANGRFGFSARGTLSLAQALYERHKVLTYPRTDSRALPEDYLATVKKTLDALAGVREFAPFAKQMLKSGWVKPNKRIFDNSKISDHFAIIPTLQTPKHLSEPEAQALRPGGAPLPRGVLPVGRVPADHAHHHGRRAPFQDRGQGPAEPGLARGLRQGAAGREPRTCPRSRRARR